MMEIQNYNFRLVAQWNNKVIFYQKHLATNIKTGKILVSNIQQKNLYLIAFQDTDDEQLENLLDIKEEYISNNNNN